MPKFTWEGLMNKTPKELDLIKNILQKKACEAQKDKTITVQNILWLQEKVNEQP